ncbi:hypothetical protein XENTR_v10013520 [Xenopus tropicalis]|uniref:Uncharacterized protein LOC101733912 isoform X1 n=1 Tax=Xenopus tropicalis TaxID=8364 RepID=A0A8J0R3R5_XENTR|nr:uncharacterized protein LOC101733912 isoform X1 [Xenopus tropicalis]KAE8601067.1 hypothetical protein XENTR_v10013520 [Xenopus tropicalis]|eukprot:XP_004914760.1 PREDICTED: uncharacterized protein LOC101733912 isoform X3 [Xenopus tropicalis]
MQDGIDQRVGALPSQKNHGRKGSGSSEENTSTRRVKLQTSFPPIHLSLISSLKPLDKKHKDYASSLDISRDVRGEKINLPQVENASENISKHGKTFPEKFKYTKDYGCNISSLASTPTLPYNSQKDSRTDRQARLEVPVTKCTTDRLSPDTAKLPECPACKNERRIRNDYDKIILQSKKEKEVLQQKVSQLEAELERLEVVAKGIRNKEGEVLAVALEQETEGHSDLGSLETIYMNKGPKAITWEDYRYLQEKNKEKQEKIDCYTSQIEGLKAQLDKMREAEREQEQLYRIKQSKVAFDVDDLKSQLEKAKENEKLKVANLENEKANILMQMDSVKGELEKFKKRRSVLTAELRKEKDALFMENEKLKEYADKIKAENAALSETVQILQKDLEKRSVCSCYPPQVYAPGAEVLLITHRSSTENVRAVGTEYQYQDVCSCGRTLQNVSLTSAKGVLSQAQEDDVRIKELYRQMKRERNLLLDVMVIMYTRRWFVEEAVPHVRRALRKCGAFSDDMELDMGH